ncbi:MAG: hypothetical protein QM684_21820 [Rhizobium sp.]
MATVAQLVEAVSVVTMVEKKTVNSYGRALIDAGILPISKGRAIAHVTPQNSSYLLLAVSLQPLIRISADMVRLYGELIAETNQGPVRAIDCIADVFGAASGGGLNNNEWDDLKLTIYESRLGLDLSLPKQKGILKFRLANSLDVPPMARVRLDPNPFFSRSASVPFDGFDFICQVMRARQPEQVPQGKECVDRIEALQGA